MTKGIEALTEKEKETLRLLLTGHTAKSAAVTLDLSVHTINDRLRDTRKKLGVTSSKQAARLLAEYETNSPQKLAPNKFGIAGSASPHHKDTFENSQTLKISLRSWTIGGLFMIALAVALALAVTSAGSSGHPTPEIDAVTKNQDAAATDAAIAWIALIDKGDWKASWDRAGTTFKSAVTAEQWAAQVEPVRVPLGSIITRSLKDVGSYDELPGAPPGEYRVVQFDSKFSDAPVDTIETAIMQREGNSWTVVGYFIKPVDPLNP